VRAGVSLLLLLLHALVRRSHRRRLFARGSSPPVRPLGRALQLQPLDAGEPGALSASDFFLGSVLVFFLKDFIEFIASHLSNSRLPRDPFQLSDIPLSECHYILVEVLFILNDSFLDL